MSDTPFTTIGDEPVEARIVAWVLGEASAFEVAELERLCEERPELMVFKRRMLAVHGLLLESGNPQADESWKLPAEKRKPLEYAFWKKNLDQMENMREKRVKHSGRRALLAIAACLVLLVIVVKLLSPVVLRKRMRSDMAEERSLTLQRELELMERSGGYLGVSEDKERTSMASRGKQRLRTELPAELIEGTPRPMNVPNSEVPAKAPAGLDTWSDTNEALADVRPAYKPRITPQSPARPTPPAASTSEVTEIIDYAKKADVPMSEVDVTAPVLHFGDNLDFGAGLGSGNPDKQPVVSGASVFKMASSDADQLASASEPEKEAKEEIEPVDRAIVSAGVITDEKNTRLDKYSGEAKDAELKKEVLHRDEMIPAAGELSKKSKPDLAKLMEEISASEDPYSTFSLNISDASFRIAQAALAKGERPDPAGIKVEQFYNAVNYGDPAPAAGEPVACAIEQAAHPVIPGRNLVRVALKTAAAGRSAAQPLRLTLLVDQSGSMSRADRRDAMDAAMRSLGTLLTDKDLVTVIGFSRTTRLLADGMKGDEVAQKLAGLVNQLASEGGTNLEEAIKLAEQMAMRRKLAGAQNRIVLFTDGAANLGDADPQRLAAKVEQLRQQGIAFDIAGIAADDLNDELLAELARKGNGRYSVVGKGEEQDFAKQLAGAFRPAAENVKVQVRFNPERVARYKLIGFEKDRLKTEDFRNDAVDAAELAAEEAGVAIYQVEPLPDGRGEIGEVSVRFRDTSSGEMVERMWTMSYNPDAPAADRATPSMQLAVLSMLAGEKLKGGPLADAIDFKNLAQAQAAVKQAFGQDARVAEMLRMVEALK